MLTLASKFVCSKCWIVDIMIGRHFIFHFLKTIADMYRIFQTISLKKHCVFSRDNLNFSSIFGKKKGAEKPIKLCGKCIGNSDNAQKFFRFATFSAINYFFANSTWLGEKSHQNSFSRASLYCFKILTKIISRSDSKAV